jgi:hypothetical protein
MFRICRTEFARRNAPATFAAMLGLALGLTAHGGPDGAGASTQIPAFYDGNLFRINIKEQKSSDPLIRNNKSINTIYATNDLDDEQDFAPVIDAIQGDGFNPLWRQVLIVFNDGFAPHQFFSDEEVLEAAAGTDPEITLVATDEVYICAVVGKKK